MEAGWPAQHGLLPTWVEGKYRMIWLALAMFISLFGWGAQYFGWHDPVGKVQLALFTSFILGMIIGYKNQS